MRDATEAFDDVLGAMLGAGEVVEVVSPFPQPSATCRPHKAESDDDIFYIRTYERFNSSIVLCIDVPLGEIPHDDRVREQLRNKVEWLPFCSVRCDRGRVSGTWKVFLTHSLLVDTDVNGEAIAQAVGSLFHTKHEITARSPLAAHFTGDSAAVPSSAPDLSGAPTSPPAGAPTTDDGTLGRNADPAGGGAGPTVDNVSLPGDGDVTWKNPALRVLKKQMTTAAVIEELNRLQGLEPVKEAARCLIANNRVQRQRRRAGMKVQQPAPHLVFTGNPGTGKTTVARLFGQLYRSLGLLTKGHVVEAKRSDLVAAYLGQTALRTRAICEKAIDGVLFIDEAYSLLGRDYDYGAEAIEELLTQMENHRGRLVVIIAGYPAEIASLLGSNPGLESRFDQTVHFPDFSDAELTSVLEAMTRENDYDLSPDARDAVARLVADIDRGPNFGNAREMRKLFEEILQTQSFRLARCRNAGVAQLREIVAEDVSSVLHRRRRPSTESGCVRSSRATESWPGYL